MKRTLALILCLIILCFAAAACSVDELPAEDTAVAETVVPAESELLPEEGVQTYVKGIIQRSENCRLDVEDEDGAVWTVTYPDAADFTSRIGTPCEVFGVFYATKTVAGGRLLTVENEDDRIVFADGTRYVPGSPYTEADTVEAEEPSVPETSKASSKTSKVPETTIPAPIRAFTEGKTDEMVWIPTGGGKRYHTSPSCSNMKYPIRVSVKTARERGFTPCQRCH